MQCATPTITRDTGSARGHHAPPCTTHPAHWWDLTQGSGAQCWAAAAALCQQCPILARCDRIRAELHATYGKNGVRGMIYAGRAYNQQGREITSFAHITAAARRRASSTAA
ncbi:hypothetical protein [Lolliginicoccus levis]|uniref:hypothetical protein n=1 Tax=Lolliginicoccus levis TaxID=2919542 RepID=UPI00241C8097|nr:hypothetical protein [Lolliginicoccus levis]